jgi:diadenosine tetraphosphate (Ap4A) HIT family hydrolase
MSPQWLQSGVDPTIQRQSMSEFELDPRLEGDSLPVIDLALCQVRLMNDARYPWLVLVPRRAGMVELFDLEEADQQQLHQDIRRCGEALRTLYRPDKLNIAALGNQVSQLHVHVIARFGDDAAWPDPVWGKLPPLPHGDGAVELIETLRKTLSA